MVSTAQFFNLERRVVVRVHGAESLNQTAGRMAIRQPSGISQFAGGQRLVSKEEGSFETGQDRITAEWVRG